MAEKLRRVSIDMNVMLKKAFRNNPDLCILMVLSTSLAVIALSGWFIPPLMLPLGLFMLFFVTGYVLLVALYPQPESFLRKSIGFASVGVSIAISGLLLMGVSYTVGLTVGTTTLAIMAWIYIIGFIAFIRRGANSKPYFTFDKPRYFPVDFGRKGTHALLSYLRIAALIFVISAFVWTITKISQSQPQFTEFYILDTDGHDDSYPTNLIQGETIRTVLGITNFEAKPTAYRIYYAFDSSIPVLLDEVSLHQGDKWEKVYEIQPDHLGIQQLTFSLYKDGAKSPYRQVYLWLTVVNP